MSLTHRKRLEITLKGEKPDRPPIAFWQHFPVDDQDPGRLAAATIAFQKQYDFDLVKVMPPSSFCLKDWGVDDQWQGNIEGTRNYTKRAIHHPNDWTKLKPLNPKEGFLGRQLACLHKLKGAFQNHTPYIQTIFNPLSQAKNLVGPEMLAVHLREHPDSLREGLQHITETTLEFVKEAKKTGISGIFFAIQHASYKILTEEEYRAFGVQNDLQILNEVQDLWANMVHIHGDHIMFDLIAQYPVQILNWHDRETSPNLAEGLAKFPGTVCGGISRYEGLTLGTPQKIYQETKEAIDQTNGKRLILGTGCVIPLTTPYGNIMTVRNTLEKCK